MEGWSDGSDGSSSGENDAEFRPVPKRKGRDKHPRTEAVPIANPPPQGRPTEAGSSTGPASKLGRGQQDAWKQSATLNDVPLGIRLLRFRMPPLASQVVG